MCETHTFYVFYTCGLKCSWGPMFVGKQIFGGLWGRYFVAKHKMLLGKIILTCLLGLFTNYGKSKLTYISVGKMTLFGLDASF